MTAAAFWKAVGGRKQFNGWLAFVAFTAMAIPLKASYETYVLGILGALGLTVGSIAYEDKRHPPRSEEPV